MPFTGRRSLASLVYLLVLVSGAYAYFALPRAQYPEVKLNWAALTTVWPGASAQDVERRVTLPLEAAVRRVPGLDYVSATSRDHVATLLLRFGDLSEAQFDRRLQALSREVQAAAAGLPREARPTQILELTTSSLFHTALVLVTDPSGGDLCRLVDTVRRDLESMAGVGRVWSYGERRPELEVRFDPARVEALGVDLKALLATVAGHAGDYPAGAIALGDRHYPVRVQGQGANPDFYGGLYVPARAGSVALSALAETRRVPGPGRERVALGEAPAVLLAVTKGEHANTFDLLRRIESYVAGKNRQMGRPVLLLADDQTEATRRALAAMAYNALLGLALVLAIAWLFLGRRIALRVCLGVPFALAVMFIALYLGGQTLNVSVLLGVAIVLGIPLDDAVVVAEAISLRIGQGIERLEAVRLGLREVAMPVTTSVLATTVAFAPLMLMPGILGKFMFTVPLTVILTLLASLAASLWILPDHVAGCRRCRAPDDRLARLRTAVLRRLRQAYGRALVAAFRHPMRVAVPMLAVFVLVGAAVAQGWLKTRWFMSDPLPIFNVNLRLPATAGLDATLAAAREAERRLLAEARPGEVRASFVVAGLQFTPSEPRAGAHLGQVTVSLRAGAGRDTASFVAAARGRLDGMPGVEQVAFQVLSADLPSLAGLNLRLSGDDPARLAAAARAVREVVANLPGLRDLDDDSQGGRPQLTLRVDGPAASRAGLDPIELAGHVRLYHDGVPVARVADGDQEIEIVVRARPMNEAALQDWLQRPFHPPGAPPGLRVRPAELFALQFEDAAGPYRRVNYQRAITLSAGLDPDRLSAREAVERVAAAWQRLRADYPGVRLEFGGEFDDVREGIAALARLAALGGGLMYLLLAWQFASPRLPLIVLATVPMAFAGAALGMLAGGMPVSLYTLYGGIALGGVAVNASIMLVAAAEDRRARGLPAQAAAILAARRRLVPILITTLAIIAGLLSVALGLAGRSVLWGPLAATLVWGLALATPMTLFATPLLYGRMAGPLLHGRTAGRRIAPPA